MSIEVASLVAGVLAGPAVVFGSLPPQGRDLDLLVRDEERSSLEGALAAAGFAPRDVPPWGPVAAGSRTWVRFRQCGVQAILVVPFSSFGTERERLERVLAEGRPLPGLQPLRRPAPHHILLLLALHLASSGPATLSERHRERAERALDEDPLAWRAARAEAAGWGLIDALDRLRTALAAPAPPQPRPYEPRRPWVPQRLRTAVADVRFLRRAPLVALSGLDGAGKSTQAEALRTTLEDLGVPAIVVWSRFEWSTLWEQAGALHRIASPVKAVLRHAESRGTAATTAEPSRDAGAPSAWWIEGRSRDRVSARRARSSLLSHGWVLVVALVHAAAQRRMLREHFMRGVLVVSDRYTLDTAAHLRRVYGPGRRFRLQTRVLALLSPRPLRAYLLDVDHSTAYARNPEQFSPNELLLQAQRYREEHARLGVRRLDGERPREQICAEIARDVWEALAPASPSRARGGFVRSARRRWASR